MIEFPWFYCAALLPLPLFIRWFSPVAREVPANALQVPFYSSVASPSSNRASGQKRFRLILAALAWILLVLAACRPQFIGEPEGLPVSGRDLMLAVDISGSMRTEDMQLNGKPATRLQIVHDIASAFIRRRIGDRLGLILFGSQAYLQTPLTFDRETVSVFLRESEIGLAGKETAIGDAIGLTIKRLRQENENRVDEDNPVNQVLILLTDGANNAGEIDPARASDLAVQHGLRIYTIGVGADEMRIKGPFGDERINPSADLDETMLRDIAEKTRGRYFRARNSEDLQAIYRLLDDLEPVVKEENLFRPKKELYYWPLAAALFLSLVITVESRFSRS